MLGLEGMILDRSVVSHQIPKATLLTWCIVVQSLALTEVSNRMLRCQNVWEESINRFKQLLLPCACVYSTLPGLRNASRRPPQQTDHSWQWTSLSSLSVVPAAPSGEISIQTTQQQGSYPNR